MSSFASVSAETLLLPSFHNILFATDFSPSSQVALPYLRAIAEQYGSTIHVAHVLTPEPMIDLPLVTVPEPNTDRNAALSSMATMLAGKPFGELTCTTTVKRGILWQALAGLIEENRIDLIVLGSHGRSGLKKIVLGSTAEQVSRLAQCPVLTVGPHALNNASANVHFANILFATDFSFGSRRALPYAMSMARHNESHLIVMHVVSASMEIAPSDFFNVGPAAVEESTELIAATIASARDHLAELIHEEGAEQFHPEAVVDCGPAAETIVSIAENKSANLIVMGARRASLGSFTNHLPWATVSTVVSQAHCPVLTVRN